MKKTIIIILAVLPIVLLVVIAFAGRILSYYQHIPVERVEFVDRLGTAYDDDDVFIVDQGKTKATSVLLYPKLASNKKVTYTSLDPDICTIDEAGNVTGVHYGTTTIMVKTDDGGKSAMLNIQVKADVPFAVYLSQNELSMKVGENYKLSSIVDAPVSMDKHVYYTSDNPEVATVDAQGKVVALSEGEAIITVTTRLGECTDTCKVTVVEGIPPLSIDLSEIEELERNDSGIYVSSIKEIDIASCIKTGEDVDPADVVVKIQSGSKYATLEDGILKLQSSGIVTIWAYTGDENAPTQFAEIKIALKRQ